MSRFAIVISRYYEDLAARVSRRFAAIGATDCKSYLRILAGEVPRRTEMHQLVGELTIGDVLSSPSLAF